MPQLWGSGSGRLCGCVAPQSPPLAGEKCSGFFPFSPRLQPALVKALSLWRKKGGGVVKIRMNPELFIDSGVTPETASVFQPSHIATTAARPVSLSSFTQLHLIRVA